jgi:hypothetical protein
LPIDHRAKLTLHLRQNMVDIYPHESILYSKETQTTATTNVRQKPARLVSASDSCCSTDGEESASQQSQSPSRADTATSSAARRKKSGQLRPLNYYDTNIFVFDTLQWEDEFNDCSEAGELEANEQQQHPSPQHCDGRTRLASSQASSSRLGKTKHDKTRAGLSTSC